jgi:hypothetical protein
MECNVRFSLFVCFNRLRPWLENRKELETKNSFEGQFNAILCLHPTHHFPTLHLQTARTDATTHVSKAPFD